MAGQGGWLAGAAAGSASPAGAGVGDRLPVVRLTNRCSCVPPLHSPPPETTPPQVGPESAVLDFIWSARHMPVAAVMRPLQQVGAGRWGSTAGRPFLGQWRAVCWDSRACPLLRRLLLTRADAALRRAWLQELRELVRKHYMPNRCHPSDHLPIGAVLRLTPTTGAAPANGSGAEVSDAASDAGSSVYAPSV